MTEFPMGPSTPVTVSPGLALVAFAAVILLLLLLIAKWKWHVFFALLIPILLLIPVLLIGALPGVDRDIFIDAFESGFGKTLGKIGVVIVLGSIMAEALKHTGAIQVITRSMVQLVGAKRMPLALTLAGFVLGLAIFSDVAYVILNPLVHSAAHVMRVNITTMSTGLVGALQLTHAIVPPTPGPLTAAIILDAHIGWTIFYGSVACLAGSLASWIWGQFVVGPRIKTPPSHEFTGKTFLDEGLSPELPGTLSSYAPIVIPICLIFAQSVAHTVLADGNDLRSLLDFIGWPVVALSIGVWLAYRNIRDKNDWSNAKNQWVEDGLRGCAMILVVTGLGGSLSAILKVTGAADTIAEFFETSGLPAILLPFVLGIVGNMITGSSTVGVIISASAVEPMLDKLALSPEAAMLSCGCGSVIFKYVNSSYFWVCTSLTHLKVSDAILSYGGATFIGGVVSFMTVYAMWSIGLI